MDSGAPSPTRFLEVTMRAFTVPAVLLALALAGCGADAPTAALPDASAFGSALANRHAAPQRPIQGHCDAETVEVEPISPTVISRVSVGTCQLSHLGRTGLLSVARTNLITLEQEAEHTLTSASGDLLYATSAGTGTLTPPATINFAGVTTISGGTGRFANATGVMQAVGTSNLAAGHSSFTYDGWIAY
jgi:hypothetical protein